MLASFGECSVLSGEPLESGVMFLARQRVFLFLCSACQQYITFDFPCLQTAPQADCVYNLVLSPLSIFPLVVRRR